MNVLCRKNQDFERGLKNPAVAHLALLRETGCRGFPRFRGKLHWMLDVGCWMLDVFEFTLTRCSRLIRKFSSTLCAFHFLRRAKSLTRSSPGGTPDNNPAFQRREPDCRHTSPEGTV